MPRFPGHFSVFSIASREKLPSPRSHAPGWGADWIYHILPRNAINKFEIRVFHRFPIKEWNEKLVTSMYVLVREGASAPLFAFK